MQNKFFNSKLNTALLIILIILMIIALRWMSQDKAKYLGTNSTPAPVTQIPDDSTKINPTKPTTPDVVKDLPGEKRFSGTITNRDDGCFSDGLCLIEVDKNYWVLYIMGWTQTKGTIEGELNIGAKVSVYAEKYTDENSEHPNTYSIIKNEKYYIKVIKKAESQNNIVLQNIFQKDKNVTISECSDVNGKIYFLVNQNVYDGFGSVYDTNGIWVASSGGFAGTTKGVYPNIDSKSCTDIYAVSPNIFGKKSVNKYNLK